MGSREKVENGMGRKWKSRISSSSKRGNITFNQGSGRGSVL